MALAGISTGDRATDMLKFIEGGAMAEEAAQLGLDYFERSGAPAGKTEKGISIT